MWRLLLPLLLGIVIGRALPTTLYSYWLYVPLGVLSIASMAVRIPVMQGACLQVVFLLVGWGSIQRLDHATESKMAASFADPATQFQATLLHLPQAGGKAVKAEVQIIAVYEENSWKAVDLNALLYVRSDSFRFLSKGSVVLGRGAITPIPARKNPHAFDYKAFLANRGITHRVFVDSGAYEVVQKQADDRSLERLRADRIAAVRTSGLQDEELGIMAALVLGDKHLLDPRQKEAFAHAGAMHVLAVSGLHVGILYLLIQALLKPLALRPRLRWLNPLVSLCVLWTFAHFTGNSPSVLRATLMFSFVTMGSWLHRDGQVVNTLLASACCMLLYDPRQLFEVGFQLSYVAVLGIVWLQPTMESWWRPRYKLLSWAWSLTTVSLAAQLATFPLGIFYFHQFPNYFLLSNFVVIPAASIILPAGLFSLFLIEVPYVSGWIIEVLHWMIMAMNIAITWIDALPYSSMSDLTMGGWAVLSLYAIILATALFVRTRRWAHLVFSFGSVLCLSLCFLHDAWVKKRDQSMTIYALQNLAYLDVNCGGRYVDVTDAVQIGAEDAWTYQIHPAHMARGMKHPGSGKGIMSGHSALIEVEPSLTVLWLDGKQVPDTLRACDVLFVVNNDGYHAASLLETWSPEEVVLSLSLAPWERDKWMEACVNEAIPVHDQSSQGAYVKTLKSEEPSWPVRGPRIAWYP